MAGPWERYKAQAPAAQAAPAQAEGPWSRYAKPEEAAPAAQQRSTGQEVGRQLGLTGRAALEGAGDLLGIFTNPVQSGLARLTGAPEQSLADAATQLSDYIGLPKPEAGLETIVNRGARGITGAGLSLGAAGLTSGLTNATASAVGNQLAAQPVQQLVAGGLAPAASEIAKQEGSGQGGQIATGLAAALAPTAAPAAGAELLRRLARGGETGRVAVQTAIDDFAKAGTTPTLGQAASAGGQARRAEAVTRFAPGGAGVLVNKLEGQQEGMSSAVESLAQRLSTAEGAERGGKAVVQGIVGPSGFMREFKNTSARLYDDVSRLLPKGTTVQAQSTRQALADLTTPIEGAEATSAVLQNSKVASIAKAFSDDLAGGGGAISYDAMKRLRTQIGELIGDSVLVPDAPTRQLRALYSAMSDDLTEAAVSTGNPAARQAVSRANKYYKAGMKRVEEIESVVDRNGGNEAVFKAMFNNAREGGTTLRRVMQSLDGASQRDLAATTLRRLGKALPGAQDETSDLFSSETFLTNWGKLSKEAKTALFDRFGSGFRNDLDQIASATANIRQSNQVMRNPGTAPLAAQMTAWGGLGLATISGNLPYAAAIGAGLAGSNVMARVFANPKIVNWMAKQTKAPASAIPASLAQLAKIAESDDDAKALLEQINAQNNPATR